VPALPSGKGGWRGGKTFGCEEGIDERVEQGGKLSRVPLH
jgi:hypothetical protein